MTGFDVVAAYQARARAAVSIGMPTTDRTTHPIAPPVTHLNVSEWFGPTIQGEGTHGGRLASFFRLAGCNLSCSWCDSAYTWDWSRFDKGTEVQRVPVGDARQILSALPGRIIVTGGEPLLQAGALAWVMAPLVEAGRQFDVETNGTRPLGLTADLWATVTCSPKVIPSAGANTNTPAWNVHPSVLTHPRAEFKFVVADQDDLDTVDQFVAQHELDTDKVWVMPEGTDTKTISGRLPWLMDAAVERRYNVSTRLHVYAWGDGRGH